MRIAVAGGTGALGRLVAAELTRRGHGVRVLSRHAQEYPVDLRTGEGLDHALEGCDAVVDSSNDESKRAADTLVGGTRHLLAAGQRAGIGHHVCVSIVGVDRVPIRYYRVKVEQEALVEAGPVPWTIVRATQFHDLVDSQLSSLARFRVLPLPRVRLQSIAIDEAAVAVADVAEGAPRDGRIDAAGPEIVDVRELARTWRAIRGRRAPIVPIWLPGEVGRAWREGANTDTDPAFRGTTRFAEWLSRRAAESSAA